ncbi:unnamed protein product [Ixodes pacificus]
MQERSVEDARYFLLLLLLLLLYRDIRREVLRSSHPFPLPTKRSISFQKPQMAVSSVKCLSLVPSFYRGKGSRKSSLPKKRQFPFKKKKKFFFYFYICADKLDKDKNVPLGVFLMWF